MNTETFADFGTIIASKIDVDSVETRKQAWDAYFNLMLEQPILLKTMPENETVRLTMETVFHHVDWLN
jgi:hypothetical protein